MCWRKSSSHVDQPGGVDSINRSRSSRLAKSRSIKSLSRNKRERGRESNEWKRNRIGNKQLQIFTGEKGYNRSLSRSAGK